MLQKISKQEILELVSQDLGISEHDKDEMAIPSHTHANPLIRWLMWERYRAIDRIGGFGKDTAVLEFGCGSGIFLPTLCANADKVYALDLFPQYAQCLCEQRGLRVEFVSELSQIPERSLDVIVAADVLEHISPLEPYLQSFRSRLKAGGRLLVSGPTENWVYKIGRWVAGFGDKGDYHVTDIHRLKPAISQAGFELRHTTALPFRLPPHLFLIYEFVAT
ncbi:MAG: class I SAM-dependent methyltransferase [Candidatus Omnitrophica bacterium]|nr:class I SAM-dependent methyltransferase [Candidatus Omnitrophota bacterium]